jgi:DNA-binding IscR family transcriptional regulator
MKISAQEEYGLRCLVQLANLADGESLTLPQIAEREGISQANAGKLMWLLNKAGFVQAGDIRLNEVIKVLDADVLNKHCESYTGVLESCVHKGDCGIRPVIVGLHEIVENALSQITLAQLVGSESSVDATFHQIQGIHRTIEPQGFSN